VRLANLLKRQRGSGGSRRPKAEEEGRQRLRKSKKDVALDLAVFNGWRCDYKKI